MRLLEVELNSKNILKFIKEKCQPFLIQRQGLPVYRGIKHISERHITICPINQNRTPMNTPKNLQILIDIWLEEHGFTALRRNSVFCTGRIQTTNLYGPPFQIFPIGEFTFIWSPNTTDLFMDYFSTNSGKLIDITDVEPHELDTFNFNQVKAYLSQRINTEKLNNLLDSLNYQKTDLAAAIRSEHEISINCDEYIAIPCMQFKSLLDKINAII